MVNKKRECTSRRKFVQEIAGAAFAGAFISVPCIGRTFLSGSQNAVVPKIGKAEEGNGEELVAVCGLYCGACPMYLASHEKDETKFKSLMQQFSAGKMQLKEEDLLCDGCLGNGRLAVFCRKCAIRSCPADKSSVTRCSDCPDFPCARITNFNNDGMLHHSEVLANLRHIRQTGMKNWARHEEDRWRCPQCRASLSWYDSACTKCGAGRSDSLFPLTQAKTVK